MLIDKVDQRMHGWRGDELICNLGLGSRDGPIALIGVCLAEIIVGHGTVGALFDRVGPEGDGGLIIAVAKRGRSSEGDGQARNANSGGRSCGLIEEPSQQLPYADSDENHDRGGWEVHATLGGDFVEEGQYAGRGGEDQEEAGADESGPGAFYAAENGRRQKNEEERTGREGRPDAGRQVPIAIIDGQSERPEA